MTSYNPYYASVTGTPMTAANGWAAMGGNDTPVGWTGNWATMPGGTTGGSQFASTAQSPAGIGLPATGVATAQGAGASLGGAAYPYSSTYNTGLNSYTGTTTQPGYLQGVAGVDYQPGGYGTGAIFNTGQTAGYDQLNGIHQTAINDFNAMIAARPELSGIISPLAMTNINLDGNGDAMNATRSTDASLRPPTSPYETMLGRNAGGRGGRPGRGDGGGMPGTSGFQPYNPYLTQIADDITRRSQDALGQGLNMIDQQAIGAGGYGGSRQAVAQAGALAQSNDNLTGQIANLLGGDWTNEQGRQVQRYGIDKSYDLGMTNANNNFTLGQGQLQLGNRNTDLSQTQLGANLLNMGTQMPWTGINNANGIYSGYSGMGNTTQSSQQGGGWQGLLGGLLSGATLGQNMGWWGGK
jgi:hypothetical protein